MSTSADVTLVARGITVTASVEVSNEQVIAVRSQGEGTTWKTSVKPGDSVELNWVAGYEERTLPAKIVGVDDGTEDVVWNLAATGAAERSQRRRSVRARSTAGEHAVVRREAVRPDARPQRGAARRAGRRGRLSGPAQSSVAAGLRARLGCTRMGSPGIFG